MKGKITIEATDYGLGICCKTDDVSIMDKFKLMHSLSTALQMDDTDMIAEVLGILKDAENQTKCMTTEQLKSLLKGEQPEGITINMTDLRRQLNEG